MLLEPDQKIVEITKSESIVVTDNSAVTLIITPRKNTRVELNIGKNCRVEAFVIPDQVGNTELHFSQINQVGGGSILKTYSLWSSAGSGQMLNNLDGTGAEAYDTHAFVEDGEKHFHLDSVLRHANRYTRGNVLIKGVVKDGASAKISGKIKIEKCGAGAESFLTERVILFNPGAHAIANPELEIENNNVSSRHAASVSQIDEEKIFYLMARGLTREEAKKTIVEGFFESVLGKIENKEMKKLFIEKILSSM